MKTWIIFVIIYGILKGLREPVKKNILKEVNLLTTLFVYTAVGFLMAVPTAKGVFDVPLDVMGLIVVKSASIFFAWIMAFSAIKKVPVSIYSVTDMSRVIFSTFMGIVFLGESLTLQGVISMIFVIAGLYLANRKSSENGEDYSVKYIWIILASCLLNGVSGTLDKYILSKGSVTSSALQMWFMLILALMYLVYIIAKKEKLELGKALKNPWIYVLSLSLIIGDRLLFTANEDPESKVTIMILLKQSSAIVAILLGKLLYNEKHILKKLACAGLILVGIMISVM